MKNKLVPSIIVSAEITVLIMVILVPFTSLSDDYDFTNYLLLAFDISTLCLLIAIYFFRNYLDSPPEMLENIFKIFFLNFGSFKINKKIYFYIILLLFAAIVLVGSIFSIPLMNLMINKGETVENTAINFLVIINIINLLCLILVLLILSLLAIFSKNFYNQSRFVLLLLPFFGWVYFFTIQKNKRINEM
ncbi:hypothetical protein [Spiroplasma alleghenense]|uniref:Transmembrane protein n=1 Tax=Spiroplasma alleghenense TaxID=216931 RepID=A0A345Z296_9MOLU|nr:hypothetical protein [Spiroplasma alleghenense]AXK50725.1 hypothetical protein SALLE_v1c00490 [Spiroplasma alleghenense]